MNQIPYTLRTLAGEEENRQGERLFRAGRVKITEQSARLLRCQVVEAGRLVLPSRISFCPATAGVASVTNSSL